MFNCNWYCIKYCKCWRNVRVGYGQVYNLSGLTAGKTYFLGTDGALIDTCPSDINTTILRIGMATSDTSFRINLGEPIIIA